MDTDPVTDRVVELLGVEPVPPGSVVILRGVPDPCDGCDGLDTIAATIARIVGHGRFVVVNLPDDATMAVMDAEAFLADLHERFREAMTGG